ncbi:hypothetical protein M5D96_010901 [Drosophila gunungcola]|uniref:peptidylamidoglycolate lyase n=1 Tax=Drosophila gunungcola TaxID=103775 RepID=A0A9P9YGR7_9MUSC|nr:hypothetical protein M5D96_010901 [Drosophila gunungcola]
MYIHRDSKAMHSTDSPKCLGHKSLAICCLLLHLFLFPQPAASQTQSSPRYLQNGDNDNNNNDRLHQILKGSGPVSSVTQLNWPQPPKQSITDVKTELAKLNSTYLYQNAWPANNVKLGAVTAVSFDKAGNVVIFHRVDRIWGQTTFDNRNEFQERYRGPIRESTILALEPATGKVQYDWGKNFFYMPHGLTVDPEENVWLTDVAMHQVFKFPPRGGDGKPLLTLGEAFKPGSGRNTRNTFAGVSYDVAPQNFFAIPHALTLVPELGLLCAADRENGRVQCFLSSNGSFHSQYHSQLIGDRLFSMAYTPAAGGQLVIVNGPTAELGIHPEHYNEVHGFVLNMRSKQLVSKFGPNNLQFQNPHDVAVTADGNEIYVAELNPMRIHKSLAKPMSLSATKDPGNSALSKTVGEEQAPSTTVHHPSGKAILVASLMLLFAGSTFALALLFARRRKRGCLPFGARSRRHAWEKSEGFKLGGLLDRDRNGFEKLDQQASDEEQETTTLASAHALESAADSEVVIRPNAAASVNKWEGEDEDEDIKDSWEDEEEKKDEEKPTKTEAPAKPKPSKALKAKLEQQARLEEEAEAERLANLSPEEKLAEKLRLQKIQEASDLKHAQDAFGVTSTSDGGLEAFNPESKEEFKEFGATLMSAADIKKVKMNVEILHSEKLKLEKANAKKPAGKGKGKVTLRTENDLTALKMRTTKSLSLAEAALEELPSSEDEEDIGDEDTCSAQDLAAQFQLQYKPQDECSVSLQRDYVLSLSADQGFNRVAVGLSSSALSNFSFLPPTESNAVSICGVRFLDEGPHNILVGTTDGYVRLYDLRLKGEQARFKYTQHLSVAPVPKSISCFDRNANGRIFHSNVFLVFYDVRERRQMGVYCDSHEDDITSVRFHAQNPDILATGSVDGLINVFNVQEADEDEALLNTFNTESSWHRNVYDKDIISCITTTGDFKSYESEEGDEACSFERPDVTAAIRRKNASNFNLIGAHNQEDGEVFLLAGTNFNKGEILRSVSVTTKNTLQPLANFQGNKQIVRESLYDSKRRLLITGGESGIVTVWSQESSGSTVVGDKLKVKKEKKSRKQAPY